MSEQTSHVGADGKRECPTCGLRQRPKADGLLPAHFDYAERRWCQGGLPPTPEEKAARKEGGSIRASSGGLPGLGRR